MVRATLQRSTAPLPTSPRTGGGVCGARNFYLARDSFKHPVGVSQNLVVPKTDEAVAVGFDAGGPLSICLDRVLPAVAFDRQAKAPARKVDHVLANRKLAREFRARLTGAQMRPENTFCIRHLATQIARGAGQSLFRQRSTPIPNPFPRGKRLSIAKAA